jgi:hypothetical protein
MQIFSWCERNFGMGPEMCVLRLLDELDVCSNLVATVVKSLDFGGTEV